MRHGRRLVLGAVLLALAPVGLARAVLIQVGFDGVLDDATGTLGGAQSFSGTIVYSTDDASCTSVPLGEVCLLDESSASISVQLDGSGPSYATNPVDPLLEILVQAYIADRFDLDQPVDPSDPNAVVRETFIPRSLSNLDVGAGDYVMGLFIDRITPPGPPLNQVGNPPLLAPSSKLAQELLGAAFDLQVDPGGAGAGSVMGSVTSAFVVPEPVTASLLLVGLAGLGVAGRPRSHGG